MRFPDGTFEWLTLLNALGGASVYVAMFIINEMVYRALDPEPGKPDRYPSKAYFGVVACLAVAALARLAPGILLFFHTSR